MIGNIQQELKKFANSVIFNSKNAENFVYQSLSKRSLNRECTKLHDAEEKRIQTLKQVSVFSSLSMSQLRIMAHSMEETMYRRGDVIIQQDDLGRDFYILEKGEVKIERKKDFNDPFEVPKELVRLKNSASFGEMALITDEVRSASVIVLSKYAICQVMRKDVFQKCVEENKRIAQQQMKIIAKEIIPHVPLFKKLSKFSLAQLLDATVPINFPQNAYICRQGSQGHTFYILVEGRCKVTLNSENEGGEESEVAKLSEGDFFGEIALMSSNHLRTANVISLTPVTCLSLSQEQFQKHFVNKKALKKLESGSSKVFSEADAAIAIDTASSNAPVMTSCRRITGLDDNNNPVELLKHDLFLRFSRYIYESRWLSVYWKMYRNICINIEKRKEAGDIAAKLMKISGSKMKVLPILETEIQKILEIHPDERQEDQLKFLTALITSNKNFMEEYCPEWTDNQIKELARRVRFQSIDSLSHIWKSGDVCTNAYMILKGSLRLFKREKNHETGVQSTIFQEDRMAGDLVGDTSLGGMKNRLYSAYSVTECDFLVIEADDFERAQGKLSNELTVQSKYEFLNQLSVFKQWDTYALYTLAQHLKQNEIGNKTNIIKCDTVADHLQFIIKGSVCVLSSHKNNKKIANIEIGGIIGESSILHHFFGSNSSTGKEKKGKNKPLKRYIEYRSMQAIGDVTLLTLDKAHFNLIDVKTVMKLHGIHRIRQKWRSSRTQTVQNEMKALKKFIREGREYAAYENRKIQLAANANAVVSNNGNSNNNLGSSNIYVNPASIMDNSDDDMDLGSVGGDDMSILSDVGASIVGKAINFSNDDSSVGDNDTIMTNDVYNYRDNRDVDSVASFGSMSIQTGTSNATSILSIRERNKKYTENEKLKDIAALTSQLDPSLDPILAYNTVKTNRDRNVVRKLIANNIDGNMKETARLHLKKNSQLLSSVYNHTRGNGGVSRNRSHMGGVSSVGSPGSISSIPRSVGGYSISNTSMASVSSQIMDTRKLS